MSARDTPVAKGGRRATKAYLTLVAELHQARLDLGKSQVVAAKQAGVDRATWSLIERGKRATVTLEMLGRMAAAVGLDISLKTYPADRVLRDAAHVRLLQDLGTVLGPEWAWQYEVPIQSPGDRRAWDASGRHEVTGWEFRAEAETALRDCQALLRRLESKSEADGRPRLVLAIRDTRTNRNAIQDAEGIIRAMFPVGAREALEALRAGRDPGGNAILMVGWPKTTARDDE